MGQVLYTPTSTDAAQPQAGRWPGSLSTRMGYPAIRSTFALSMHAACRMPYSESSTASAQVYSGSPYSPAMSANPFASKHICVSSNGAMDGRMPGYGSAKLKTHRRVAPCSARHSAPKRSNCHAGVMEEVRSTGSNRQSTPSGPRRSDRRRNVSTVRSFSGRPGSSAEP